MIRVFIGVAIGLVILCKLASAPILDYIKPIYEKIVVPPPIKIVEPTPIVTPVSVPQPREIQIEKYPEIRNFLNDLPNCDWCSACGSYAHYTRTKAEEQGIKIGEITITDTNRERVKQTVMDGHRINYFYADDGHRVYIDNMHNWNIILEGYELKQHIKNKFGFNLTHIGFKNIKQSKLNN